MAFKMNNRALDKKTTADWWAGFDSDLWNMGIDPEARPLERYDQLVAEMSAIEENKLSLNNLKSIDFDLRPDKDTRAILRKMPEWINMIVDKIDPNDKWMVFYQYNNAWRSRKLDEITGEMLKNQVCNDINDYETFERKEMPIPEYQVLRVEAANYDFMPVAINTCQIIRIVNFHLIQSNFY